MRHRTILLAALALILPAALPAATRSGFDLSLLVGDSARTEYFREGTVYVEAVRGREYALRISNPTPWRVAVALSVDGLNTLDAKHTSAAAASKWVLGPYESTVISGWQVNGSTARRFFFTTEKRSYGAALGQTDNLGVIEAVFYRERQPVAQSCPPQSELDAAAPVPPAAARKQAAEGGAAGSPAPQLSSDYAATGMGDRTRHAVRMVDIDLESEPIASIRLRYEFRPELVRLGILPSNPDPLDRRERAHGFDSWCPEVQ